MRLRDLVDPAELDDVNSGIEILGLTADSRQVKPGWLFAALPGLRADGAVFAPAAINAGAAAILASPAAGIETPPGVALIRDGDPRARFARLAAIFYAPQPRFIAAVTGTNGKTSVASFTQQIWTRLGRPSGSIGTLGVSGLTGIPQVSLTSPDPVSLHRALHGLRAGGINHVAIEASSHGLVQRRLDGVRLCGGAFTNISRDHLDYHDSFAAYFAAKLRLFRTLLPRGARAAINLDGAGGDAVLAAAAERGLDILTVGRKGEHLKITGLEPAADHLRLEVEVAGIARRLVVPLVGGFQAENALLSAALATSDRSVPLDEAIASIEHLQGACGRLERVGVTAAGAQVFVDYAHTPDALSVALTAIRPHTHGRLLVVFGAGGDRDTGKRPLMGKAAARHADIVIVTDDNPRSEDPASIRAQVLAGAAGAIEIGDRREAIADAIGRLVDGDVLLIAGKGHEQGQVVGDKVLPFSDHEVVRSVLGVGGSA